MLNKHLKNDPYVHFLEKVVTHLSGEARDTESFFSFHTKKKKGYSSVRVRSEALELLLAMVFAQSQMNCSFPCLSASV